MPAKVYSAAVVGLDAQIIEVETDVSYGQHPNNYLRLELKVKV